MKKFLSLIFLTMCVLTMSAQMSHPVIIWQGGNKMTLNSVDSITFVQTPDVADSEFVDLGLSVKWAKCNIGATREDQYGSYFAWGETKTKTIYDWNTYTYCDSSRNKLTKYCTDRYDGKDGFTDNKNFLESGDDAATVLKGKSYRLPTYDDYLELSDNCTWEVVVEHNHRGYKITGPNGNSIFMPATGSRSGQTRDDVGTSAYYWLGQCDNSSAYAIHFDFSNSYFYSHNVTTSGRANGFTIRPVLP